MQLINLNLWIFYNSYLIVLNNEREVLYNRINKRVELMFEQGLEDEVDAAIRLFSGKENSEKVKEIRVNTNNSQIFEEILKFMHFEELLENE